MTKKIHTALRTLLLLMILAAGDNGAWGYDFSYKPLYLDFDNAESYIDGWSFTKSRSSAAYTLEQGTRDGEKKYLSFANTAYNTVLSYSVSSVFSSYPIDNYTFSMDFALTLCNTAGTTRLIITDNANNEVFKVSLEGKDNGRGSTQLEQGAVYINGSSTAESATVTMNTFRGGTLTWYNIKIVSNETNGTRLTLTRCDNTTETTTFILSSGVLSLGTITGDPSSYNQTVYGGIAFDNFELNAYYNPQEWVSGNSFMVPECIGELTSNKVSAEGITMEIGNASETQVVRNDNFALSVIDISGFTFKRWNYAVPDMGTYYKFTPSLNRTLTVRGYFDGPAEAVLYDATNSSQVATIANAAGLVTASFSLTSGHTYYLYGRADNGYTGTTFCLKSFSYVGAYFTNSYAIASINETYTQTVNNLLNAQYSIVGTQGDLASAAVSVNPTTGVVSGLTAGGAVKIQATNGLETATYVLTVAYEATAYPGHIWDFYTDGTTTTDGLKTVPNPKADPNTTTGLLGETWRAEYKNSNAGKERGPQWYMQTAVTGDNAFYVPETAGLVFLTATRNFYLRNDDSEFKHIGIRGVYDTPSFTIPRLKAGDIVEINWKHDADDSGATYSATNLKDLRDKVIPDDDTFLITKSQDKSHRGWYSFVVRDDGDVTFTLHDNGNTDILTIRIYSGGYHITMRDMREADGNVLARPTLLLDNAEQDIQYNYCNQMYSTGTGPAFCVLKGYVHGRDDVSSVTGSNAAVVGSNTFFADEDAYPISQEESDRLYDLRKNLVDFKMYNSQWYRINQPTYNYGHIAATSGYGKVTIRMNNYTNDMKYLIGYTPDYTLTIGSAPHQEYPYTWDFTHVSAQEATAQTDNVVSSIEAEGSKALFSGMAPTNWDRKADATYLLNTDNSGEYGSQYVPGAVLVSQDRALSAYPQGTPSTKYALDELDGLGFNGDLALYTQGTATTSWNRATIEEVTTLLSMQMDDYVNKTTEVVDGEETVTGGTFAYTAREELPAGNGLVAFGADKFEFSTIAACGFGFKSDGDGGSSKWIYLKPQRAFQAGDIITVKAYAKSNPSGSDYGVSFYESSSSVSALETLYLGAKVKNVEVALAYTVTAGDGIAGREGIYLFRASEKSTYITEVSITGIATVSIPTDYRKLYAVSETTITVPDLNADGKQDWIYVSASAAPTAVENAAIVTTGADGADGNPSPEVEDADARVYKYKVESAGNAYLTFAAGTKIYKIGVTHILKEIHPVGGVGWATESRDHEIDHALTGYFTVNDVNAFTVGYDSYNMETATVALTPVNEDGYVARETGIVLRLDNGSTDDGANLTKANGEASLYRVPLFYPSYTLGASSTAVDFPSHNLMYPNLTQRMHTSETDDGSGKETGSDYTKFILTNIHWTFDTGHTLNTDEQATGTAETDAAAFYRMHVWETTGDAAAKNTLAANTAYLLVPTASLPDPVWSRQQTGGSARPNTLPLYNDSHATGITAPDSHGDRYLGQSPAQVPVPVTAPWYTLSGMRLEGRPTAAGVYIHGGQKVVVRVNSFTK